MLGHVVARFFAERGYDVLTSNARYTAAPDDHLLRTIRGTNARVVVNCLGRIKQKSTDTAELYRSNTLFPIHLLETLEADQYLIHASSDCVFAGSRGSYAIDDRRDADDVYGVSKALGETIASDRRATVIRTSVIGPAMEGQHGLMAWFFAQPVTKAVPGFTNHIWNGVTTLEWAQIAAEIIAAIDEGEVIPDLVQPGTDPVSKYELLGMIRDAFKTQHVIEPVEAPAAVDRSLVPTDVRQSLRVQLAELAAW